MTSTSANGKDMAEAATGVEAAEEVERKCRARWCDVFSRWLELR